jgi:hypothetical protein
LSLLAGCAGGTKDDARQAAEREATEAAVVAAAEATQVFATYFAGTPSPQPSPTPAAKLASLVLSSRIGTDGAPGDNISGVFGASRIYAAAQIAGLQRGWTVQAVWRRADGKQVAESSVELDSVVSPMWLAFPWDVPAGAPPGDYGVFIYINGELLESLAFRVG